MECFLISTQRFRWVTFDDDLIVFDTESGDTHRFASPCGLIMADIETFSGTQDSKDWDAEALASTTKTPINNIEAALSLLADFGLLSRQQLERR